jgi:hypothetical protein
MIYPTRNEERVKFKTKEGKVCGINTTEANVVGLKGFETIACVTSPMGRIRLCPHHSLG